MNDKEYQGVIKLLEKLDLDIEKKEDEIKNLKKQRRDLNLRTRRYGPKGTGVQDRDGAPICFGDTVYFLTRGLHNSKEGVVYKVAKNGSRITAKDSKGNSVSRAPHNVRVKDKDL